MTGYRPPWAALVKAAHGVLANLAGERYGCGACGAVRDEKMNLEHAESCRVDSLRSALAALTGEPTDEAVEALAQELYGIALKKYVEGDALAQYRAMARALLTLSAGRGAYKSDRPLLRRPR